MHSVIVRTHVLVIGCLICCWDKGRHIGLPLRNDKTIGVLVTALLQFVVLIISDYDYVRSYDRFRRYL